METSFFLHPGVRGIHANGILEDHASHPDLAWNCAPNYQLLGQFGNERDLSNSGNLFIPVDFVLSVLGNYHSTQNVLVSSAEVCQR